MRYTTTIERVDKDTGEVLTKADAELNYITIKNEQTYKQINHETIERKITKICERRRQLRLF